MKPAPDAMHHLAITAVFLALLTAVGCLVAPLVAINGRRDEEDIQ